MNNKFQLLLKYAFGESNENEKKEIEQLIITDEFYLDTLRGIFRLKRLLGSKEKVENFLLTKHELN